MNHKNKQVLSSAHFVKHELKKPIKVMNPVTKSFSHLKPFIR